MTRPTRTFTMAALAVVLIAVTFQWAFATHSWNGYHWARTSNSFTLKLGDNVSGPAVDPGAWDLALNTASSDWSDSTVLDTRIVVGQSKANCRPTSGQVEVCNGAYGPNGWLGVAQIWITGGVHITQGAVKLNDTYFNTTNYNTTPWRNLVTCQEIGHTLGLDHQDVDFNNANLGTCMDYTNDPSTNQHPNTHDYQELVAIYAHPDSFNSYSTSTGTVQTTRGASGAVLEAPSEWGQLMKTSQGGRTQVFERDFGNGERIVTFVIWA